MKYREALHLPKRVGCRAQHSGVGSHSGDGDWGGRQVWRLIYAPSYDGRRICGGKVLETWRGMMDRLLWRQKNCNIERYRWNLCEESTSTFILALLLRLIRCGFLELVLKLEVSSGGIQGSGIKNKIFLPSKRYGQISWSSSSIGMGVASAYYTADDFIIIY